MIRINNKDVVNIYIGSKPLNSIYKKDKLVWGKTKEILSCFSNGYWIDAYPWVDSQVWSD